tara:strand:+ start:1427 stop:1552 length:126 start_codon:yes stop_codon:yes gene_type:complete
MLSVLEMHKLNIVISRYIGYIAPEIEFFPVFPQIMPLVKVK